MNRLAQERSPYLLQHAENPVDWYPWGQEAFERARREDKPIFLSIGYSTCHWCHVMEHESFENPAHRRAAQPRFRLDQGGSRRAAGRRSRLHVVRAGDDRIRRLADDGVPDAGAEAVLRRHVLPAVVALGAARIRGSAGRARARLERGSHAGEGAAAELLQRLAGVTGDRRQPPAESELAPRRRARHGRRAVPRCVRSTPRRVRRRAEVSAAFRAAVPAARACATAGAGVDRRTPLLMATETLRAMALGGMRDHIGGGFHRYSVDGEWRVPHFEKMLYDQAQLVLAYLEAAQATGDDVLRGGRGGHARLRPARHDGSAAAASIPPRTPTAFLPSRRATPARTSPKERSTSGRTRRWERCSVTTPTSRGGGSGSSRPAMRRAIRKGSSPARTCSTRRSRSRRSPRRTGRAVEDVDGGARPHSRARCSPRAHGRPRPHLDDKVLTAWNGLMIAAFARAARVLVDRPSAADAISTRQPGRRRSSGTRSAVEARLLRRYRDGDAAIDGVCRGLRISRLGSAGAVPGRRRPAMARVGADAPGAAGRASSGTHRTAAGSARPARIRRFCFGSRKTTMAPSPRRAPSRR